jgi:hypothetical protein
MLQIHEDRGVPRDLGEVDYLGGVRRGDPEGETEGAGVHVVFEEVGADEGVDLRFGGEVGGGESGWGGHAGGVL